MSPIIPTKAEQNNLIPAENIDNALQLFTELKTNLSNIHRNLHEDDPTPSETILTDEESKVAEMMEAFHMKR